MRTLIPVFLALVGLLLGCEPKEKNETFELELTPSQRRVTIGRNTTLRILAWGDDRCPVGVKGCMTGDFMGVFSPGNEFILLVDLDTEEEFDGINLRYYYVDSTRSWVYGSPRKLGNYTFRLLEVFPAVIDSTNYDFERRVQLVPDSLRKARIEVTRRVD